MEFQNIIQQVRDINFAKDISCQSSSDHSIVYESVMSDPLSDVPLCIFTNFPSDEFAREVAKRSCLIRSIVQVYGDGKSAEECSQASSVNMPNILAQERVDNLTSEESNKSSTWRVTFRRHGREGKSGLDPAGKRQRLAIFTPALKLLGGSVDLLTPSRDLLYLEDWTGFVESERRNTDISTVPSIDNEGNEKDDDRSHSNKDKSILNELTIFSPTRCLFGRIIAEGPSIFNMFELSSRPFIGTTSMDPLSSHLAAVAANIKANDLVLDPYCGTGSLLIACAHMGAEVIGSDFDSYNFGLDFPDAPTDEANLPSTDTTTAATNPIIVKYGNRAFKRVKGRDQSNKSVFDNFKHYNMDDRCVAMINADSLCWIPLDEEMHKSDVGPEHYYFPVSSQGVVELNQVSTSSPTHLVVAGLHTARVVSYPDNVSRSLKLRDVFEIPDDLCPELSPSGLPIHTLLRSQLKLTRKV